MNHQEVPDDREYIQRMRNGLLGLLMMAVVGISLGGCLGKSAGGSLVQQGMLSLEQNDYETALATFNEAIAARQDRVLSFRGRGIAQMGLARYEDAASSFEQALSYTDRKMPDTIRDIRLYLATARYRSGSYGDVVTVCNDILSDKEIPEAWYYLGAAYLALGDPDQARLDFNNAVALSPNDYALYLQIYQLYEAQDKTAIGDEYLQTALQIQPETAEDYYRIGQIYFYLEKYEDARNTLNMPVEEHYLPAMELMGEIYLALEDYPHAQAVYQTIMDENGEKMAVYNGLAMCSIAAGDYEIAMSDIHYGLSLEDDGSKQSLLFNEIVAYERMLDFDTALDRAEAFHSLYPTDEQGQKELTFLRTRERLREQ